MLRTEAQRAIQAIRFGSVAFGGGGTCNRRRNCGDKYVDSEHGPSSTISGRQSWASRRRRLGFFLPLLDARSGESLAGQEDVCRHVLSPSFIGVNCANG